MKTAKQWFEQLPEPYRTQAIENTKNEHLKSKLPSLREAIFCSFAWEITGQGPMHWYNLIEKLDSNQIKLTNND